MLSQKGGRELLAMLKAHARPHGPTLSLPVGSPVEAILRPVATREGQLNAEDVRVLTEWRNRFVQSFQTEFQADEDRTARWLTQTVGPEDTRILFMVDDGSDGRTIGYMGLAFIDWEKGVGEADAIVRGAPAPHGLMSRALRTMLAWGRSQLGLATLGVRVRSDNSAVSFYRKLGFHEVKRVPLRRIEREGMVEWREDESLVPREPQLVHMLFPDDV